MDTHAWFRKKKGLFYILILFQTIVILFTSCYVIIYIRYDGPSARPANSYQRNRDLKSELIRKKYQKESRNALNFYVMANGRVVNGHERAAMTRVSQGKRLRMIGSNEERFTSSDVRKYDEKNVKNNSKNMEIEKRRNYWNTRSNKNNKNNNDLRKNRKIIKKSSKIISIGRSNKYPVKKLQQTTSINEDAPNQKKPILIFIAIMSAPQRIHRRNALRRSWLRQCQDYNTSCYIFTDALDTNGQRLPEEIYVTLEQERFLHKDLILSQSPGGINFARRYLWIINWASAKYTFDFLLRVDDDYFICMDRLFLELPYRKTVKKLYWGHVHCHPPGGVRVDEGFVIVSNDLVQLFIQKQNNSLMCHPFGDQAMAMWINDIENVKYFGDQRVHYGVTANVPMFENHAELCNDFLALHGSYPIQLEQYWQKIMVTPSKRYPVPKISYPCGDQDRKYNKTNFEGMYYADPAPCKDLPVWNISEVYVGRSGQLAFN